MKIQIGMTLATLLAVGGAAAAQTAPGSATGPAAVGAPSSSAPAADTPALTPAQQANRDRIKGERQTCRTEAQGQGLKGPAVRAAVLDCMAKVDPVAGKRMACNQAARAKNLTGDDLRKSVRDCMRPAG